MSYPLFFGLLPHSAQTWAETLRLSVTQPSRTPLLPPNRCFPPPNSREPCIREFAPSNHRTRKYSSNRTPSTPVLRHTTVAARRRGPVPSHNSNRSGTIAAPGALSWAPQADELWMVHSSARDPFAKLITPACDLRCAMFSLHENVLRSTPDQGGPSSALRASAATGATGPVSSARGTGGASARNGDDSVDVASTTLAVDGKRERGARSSHRGCDRAVSN